MKILLSACLAGVNCRYNAIVKDIDLRKRYPEIDFVLVCPEVIGGLLTPRKPAEICNGQIIDCDGNNVTDAFTKGARKAYEIALNNNCVAAILKARSPSCGSNMAYDGTFTGTLVSGDGIFAAMLKDSNIKIFSEEELNSFENWLKRRDT